MIFTYIAHAQKRQPENFNARENVSATTSLFIGSMMTTVGHAIEWSVLARAISSYSLYRMFRN